jgi:hypothetical protein
LLAFSSAATLFFADFEIYWIIDDRASLSVRRPYEQIIANRVPYMARKWLRHRRRSEEDKVRLYRALVRWGMGGQEARKLIAKATPRKRVRYLRQPPYHPHMNASRPRRRPDPVRYDLDNRDVMLVPQQSQRSGTTGRLGATQLSRLKETGY